MKLEWPTVLIISDNEISVLANGGNMVTIRPDAVYVNSGDERRAHDGNPPGGLRGRKVWSAEPEPADAASPLSPAE